MKTVTTSLVVLFFSLALKAQRLYFVYIQTENKQPFFLTLNETIHSSTPSGYLILSKLRDSTYRFSIGFPNNIAPEQKFSVSVNRKDHGYILKDFGTKGWGLFDLQTMGVQMSASVPSVSNVDFAVLRTTVDPFTAMLSRATDDPSLLQRIVIPRPEEKKPAVVKKEEIKDKAPEEKNPVVVKNEEIKDKTPDVKKPASSKTGKTTSKKDAVKKLPQVKTEVKTDDKKDVALNPPITIQEKEKIIDTSEVKKESLENLPDKKVAIKENTNESLSKSKDTIQIPPELKIQEEKKEIEYKKSKVIKRSESSTTEGFGLVFIDEEAEGQKDTIKIMIPNERWVAAGNDVIPPAKKDKKFLDIDDPQTIKDATTEEKNQVTPLVVAPTEKPVRVNSCNQVATESDFYKVRRRMAAQSKEDNMIDEAKKYFRSKCYTTEQVKNLSALFLTNGGKYKFFDSAYTHVSDLENFPSLETELKDEYFIKRFKAMLFSP